MKARKADCIRLFAGMVSGLCLFGMLPASPAVAQEESPAVTVTAETVVAAQDGSFCLRVTLDELPESGLCALEFAVEYDQAAFTVTETELLYDTGAQAAEDRVHSDLYDTVFTCEDRGGLLYIRWATGLENPEYWLSEEQPLLMISGTLTDAVPKGTRTELKLVPAPIRLADGTEVQADAATAGYSDAEGNLCRADVTLNDGAVWMPLDDQGATMYGDVNLDGEVNVADAVLLSKVVCEEGTFSAAAYANADCDADGFLTIADVTLMLRSLVGEPEASALGKA